MDLKPLASRSWRAFAPDGGDLEHDGSVCEQRRACWSGIFWRRRGLWGSRGRFPARRAALAGEWRGRLRCRAWLFHWLQMVLGGLRFGGMIKIPIRISLQGRRGLIFRLSFRFDRG